MSNASIFCSILFHLIYNVSAAVISRQFCFCYQYKEASGANQDGCYAFPAR